MDEAAEGDDEMEAVNGLTVANAPLLMDALSGN